MIGWEEAWTSIVANQRCSYVLPSPSTHTCIHADPHPLSPPIEIFNWIFTTFLFQDLLMHIESSPPFCDIEGAVLIFLPGLADIQELYEMLTTQRHFNDPARYCRALLLVDSSSCHVHIEWGSYFRALLQEISSSCHVHIEWGSYFRALLQEISCPCWRMIVL